jgi:hypothetical protein
MQMALPGHLGWRCRTDLRSILGTSMHGGGADLPFSIGCRTDAMIVATRSRSFEEAAIVATMELKKKVVKQSLRQTKATFVCASLKSQLPVISCVTDMKKTAVAYYTPGEFGVLPANALLCIGLLCVRRMHCWTLVVMCLVY